MQLHQLHHDACEKHTEQKSCCSPQGLELGYICPAGVWQSDLHGQLDI